MNGSQVRTLLQMMKDAGHTTLVVCAGGVKTPCSAEHTYVEWDAALVLMDDNMTMLGFVQLARLDAIL